MCWAIQQGYIYIKQFIILHTNIHYTHTNTTRGPVRSAAQLGGHRTTDESPIPKIIMGYVELPERSTIYETDMPSTKMTDLSIYWIVISRNGPCIE